MGILSVVHRDLLSNSKSQLKYFYSLSNLRFIRRISSPAAVDDSSSKTRQSPNAPTLVGDLKSNNKKLMFLLEHFHNGSGNYIRVYSLDRSICFPPYNYSLVSAEKSWTDHHKLCNTPFSGYGDSFLCSSCNELVLFFFEKKGERIGLWNPTTNKIKILPQSHHVPARRPGPASANTVAHGFGFDPVSEDYKVVRFVRFGYKDGSDTFGYAHVELYSLKTNSWKKIMLYPHHGEPHQIPSVHVNGFYYWVDFTCTPTIILSFDFENEKFSVIPSPPQFDDRRDGVYGFYGNFVPVEFNGSVAALVHSQLENTEEEPFSFEVWGWNGESWLERVSRITIVVPDGVVRVLGLFQDDKLLLLGLKIGELWLFDLAKRKLENLGILANSHYMQIFPFVSVPHN